MAQVTSAVTPVASDTNAAGITTDSFTPDPFDLLVVIVCGINVSSNTYEQLPVVSSVAGMPGFVQVFPKGVYVNGADVARIWMLVGQALEVPVARTITVTMKTTGTATGTFWGVYRVSGMKRTGFGAIRQAASQDNGTTGNTPTVAFPAACLTGNPVIGLVMNTTNPATVTPPAGFTETIDTGGAAPVVGYEMVSADSGFTGSSLAWGGTSPSNYAALAVELDTRTIEPGQAVRPPTIQGRGAV